MLKKWLVAPPAPASVLRQYGQMNPVVAQVLYNRGFAEPQAAHRFLYDRDVDTNPFLLKGMNQAVGRIRAAIKKVAPGAIETTSYFDIPGYSYPGYDYNGMFAWFSFRNSFIGLHVRPPTIENHKKEVAGYATTKAIVKFPCDSPVPVPLVRKLVKASIALMKGKKSPPKDALKA